MTVHEKIEKVLDIYEKHQTAIKTAGPLMTLFSLDLEYNNYSIAIVEEDGKTNWYVIYSFKANPFCNLYKLTIGEYTICIRSSSPDLPDLVKSGGMQLLNKDKAQFLHLGLLYKVFKYISLINDKLVVYYTRYNKPTIQIFETVEESLNFIRYKKKQNARFATLEDVYLEISTPINIYITSKFLKNIEGK